MKLKQFIFAFTAMLSCFAVSVNAQVAKIGGTEYTTLADALDAAKAKTGDVTVELYEKVTLNQPLNGSFTTITFVGKDTDAEIYLDVQGYITATNKKVAFKNLTLSKSQGGFIANAGFMNVAFGVYDVAEVTYTNCTFANGAYASSGKVTFNGCTFKKSWDKYGLWAYGNVDVTVQGSTFADYRGIKMYAENGADASVEKANLTVKNTNFSAVDNKPAIVLTYGESVVLEGNTYSSTGTFELDLDGKPNGVAVTSDVAPTCVNDNGACGVLVDGKIYTTVAQAAEVATAGSTVTLLHNSTETVKFPEGVTLNKNGFTANGVTVVAVAKIGDVEYATLQAALDAAAAGTGNVTVTILADVDLTGVDWNPVTVSAPGYPVVTVEGNGKTITGLNDMLFAGTWAGKSGLIIKNLTIANSAIVNDKDDAKGTVGVGAFIGYPQASATITLENCHLKNSSVEGGHWTGGLIGMAGGYNGADGPVFMNLTIKGCSVTGSTITGKGSVGGVIGHGSCAAWTNVVIEETTVSDNTITSTGLSNVKAGAVMGTIGAAGQPTTVNGVTNTGGMSVSATVAENTVKSNGTKITTIYGRQGTETGMLYVAGGSYDNYPIEKGVAYAAPAKGYKIVENNGTYGIVEDPEYGKVAKVGDACFETLAQAVAAVEDGGTITLIANETFTENNRYNNGGWWDGLGYSGDKSFTIDLAGFTISQNGALNDYLMWFKNDGAKDNIITLKNGTLDAGTTAYCALATASSNAKKITVNLENIQLINNNSNGATLKIRGGAELNANAGTIITGKNSYLGIEAAGAKTVVNIYEGAEIYQNGTSSYCGCLAGASGNSTINVYGGYGKGVSGGFIAMTSGGTINVEGGEWIANTDGTYANGNKSVLVAQSDKGAKSIVNVTGGTFKGGYNCYGNAVGDAQINIKGGNFNADPTSYVAEDYIAVKNNGVWNVVKAAAKIGKQGYATVDAAIKAAQAGETVTIFEGTYKVPAMKAGITVVGEGEVLLEGTLSGTLENLTLKNLHIKGGNAQRWAYGKGNLVFENVIFEATSIYALHFDGIAEGTNLTYKNCTIIGWAAMGGSPESCVFDGCTIKGNGTYGVIRTYFDTTIKGCTFDVANVSTTDAYEDGIHAVDGAEVVVNDCINANGDMKDIVNVHGASVVTVDGEEIKNAAKAGNKYYATFEEAFAAVQAGETLTLLADLNLSDILTINKAITFDGNGKKLTSTAGRAINVSGADGVTIKNLTINASGERAINVIQNATNVTVENVTATAANYTVNVATSAPKAVVAISGSNLTGLNVVNVAAPQANVTINGGTITCNDQNEAENYAALALNKDAVGAKIAATGVTFDIKGDSKKAKNGAEGGVITIDGKTDEVVVNVAYIHNGGDYYYAYPSLEAAIANAEEGETITLLRDLTMDYNARDAYETQAKNVVINGNGKTLTLNQKNSDWASIGLANNSKLVLNNMTIEKTGYGDTSGAWNTHAIIFSCPVEMNNVTVNNAIAVQAGATLNNVTINEANAYYGLWINGNGQEVTINGGAINANKNGGRGIKIADQYIDSPAQVTLSVDGTVFSTAKKAAVLVSSKAGAKITAANVDIANVAEDSENFVWVDEDWAEYFSEVEVTGATVSVEGADSFAAAIKVNGTVQSYFKTLAEAVKACVAGDNTIELLADCAENVTITQVNGTNITINGNGKTYTGTITVKGDKIANNLYNTETLTFKNINFAPAYGTYAITAEKNTYARNITVDGCTFKGNNDVYGIRVRNGYNYTVKNTTAEGVYTFLNASEALSGLTVENVTVKCSNVAFSGAYGFGNASFKKVTVESANNGVKVNNPNGSDLTFEGCSITAKTPVTFIESAGVTSALTAEFNGTNTMVVNNGGTYWFNIVEADATDATFKAVVNDANLDMSNTAFAAAAGNVYYNSLQKAIDAAVDGDVVTLAKNIELDAANCVTNSDGYSVFVNVAGKAVTIDLNGKAITANLSADQFASAKSSLLMAVLSVDTNGNLTLNDSKGTGKVAVTANDASVYSLISNYDKTAKLTINGGSYELDKARATGSLIHSDPSEAVVVNGGNFYLGNVGTGANGQPWIFNVNGNNTGHVIVNGGTFNYDVNHQYWAFEVHVDKESALKNNGNGTWTVVPAVAYVAEQNNGYTRETGYATLEDAMASKYGNEVTMLTDIALAKTVTVPAGKEVVLDLNGKTISANITEQLTKSFAAIQNKGTLTVKDASTDAAGKISVSYAGNTFGYGMGLYTISNEGGVLNIEGGTIENLCTVSGSMYDAIDNNSTLGNTVLNISGGSVICGKYIAIRQFANNTTADNTVNISGGDIMGGNTSIWMQNPNSKANKATLTITGDDYENENYPTIEGRLLAGESTGFVFNVKGGLFDTDVNDFCAPDYASYDFGDGTWGVEYTVIESLDIVDGTLTEFVNQNEKTVGTLTYTRGKIKNTWTPFYVPFAVPVSALADKFDVAYINDVRRTDSDNDGELDKFSMEVILIHCESKNVNGSSKTLKANYPYFIRSKSGQEVTMEIALTDATLYAAKENIFDCTTMTEKFEIKGNYNQIPSDKFGENDYVVGGGVWGNITPGYPLNPFRFYMTRSSRDGSDPTTMTRMKSMKIVVCGEEDENGATIIYDVVEDSLNNNGNDFIYDLQGRRVSEPKKGGIYIKNGKKILF